MSILPGDELDELLTVDKTLFVVKDVFLIWCVLLTINSVANGVIWDGWIGLEPLMMFLIKGKRILILISNTVRNWFVKDYS
jgi:hypothetical protein